MNELYKQPLHLQMKELIRSKIESGEYPIGIKIPSETELSKKYDININTIKGAIKILEKEGVLIRVSSKRLYVAPPKITHNLNSTVRFTESTFSKNSNTNSKIINQYTYLAGKLYAKKFSINEEDLILFVKKVSYEREIPVSLEKIFIPKKILPKIEGINLSIFNFDEIYSFYNITCSIVKQNLSIIGIEAKDAKLIGLTHGSPVMSLQSFSYSKDNHLIEYRETHARADKVSFNVCFNK